MNRADIGMMESGRRLSFALGSIRVLGGLGHRLKQKFEDGDNPPGERRQRDGRKHRVVSVRTITDKEQGSGRYWGVAYLEAKNVAVCGKPRVSRRLLAYAPTRHRLGRVTCRARQKDLSTRGGSPGNKRAASPRSGGRLAGDQGAI